MGKLPLKKKYYCQAVCGCPNLAYDYNDSRTHDLLYCNLHRLEPFKPDAIDCNPRRMFSKIKEMKHSKVIEWAEITNSIYSLETNRYLAYQIAQGLPINPRDVEVMNAVFNYLSRHLRLFDFYRKLAHFQVMNVDIFRDHLENNLLTEDISRIFLKYRETFEKLMNDPIIVPAMDIIFTAVKLYLENAPRNDHKDPNGNVMNIVNSMIKSAPYTLINFHKNAALLELIKYPVISEFVNSKLKYEWKFYKCLLNEELSLNSEYDGYLKRDFDYYYTNALALQRLGEYKYIFRILEKAEKWLEEQEKNLKSYKNRHMHPDIKSQRREDIDNKRTKLLYIYGVSYFDLSLYHKSLDCFKQYLKKVPSAMKDCQSYIAVIFMSLKDFRRALKFAKKGKENIADFNEISGLYQLELGKYDQAYSYFKKCGSSMMKSSIVNHMIYDYFPHFKLKIYKSLVNRGIVQCQLGHYDKALYKFKIAKNRIWRGLRESHPYVSKILNWMGMAHEKMHDYDLALECYYEALDIEDLNFTKGACVRLETIIRIGSAFIGKNYLKLAMAFLKTAKDIIDTFNTIHDDHVEFYCTFGRAFQAIGDIWNARNYYYKALSVETNLHGFNHLSCARIFLLIGTTMEGWKNRVFTCRKVVKIARTVLEHSRHPLVAQAWELIGDNYFQRGYFARTGRYYRRAKNLIRDHFSELGIDIIRLEEKINSLTKLD